MLELKQLEPEVEEYLTLKGDSTKRTYSAGYRAFMTFYEKKYSVSKVFSHFLDRIFDEFKKPPREQKRIIETELADYINFLKAEGKSNNSIRVYICGIQNFLKYKHIMVSTRFVGNLPPPVERRENGKHEWRIEQIKMFVDKATSYRDKAIILCMFQSGLAVKEICRLDYGDIQKEFEKGILPICLKLVRKKQQLSSKLFLDVTQSSISSYILPQEKT